MRYFLILLLTSFWGTGFSQEEYTFNEVLEYDYVDIKEQKKWKWMQLHNSQHNSYKASIHVQDSSTYWFNLTFLDSPRHARFKIDNYVLAEGYTIKLNQNNIHNNIGRRDIIYRGKSITYRNTSKYIQKNFMLTNYVFNKDSSKVNFEIVPKNDRLKKRYKLSSYYYEIDTSKQNHKINFIRNYVRQLYEKTFDNTIGVITKRCEKNVKGEIVSCIDLKEVHKLRSLVIIED